jgi:hypothetical protein
MRFLGKVLTVTILGFAVAGLHAAVAPTEQTERRPAAAELEVTRLAVSPTARPVSLPASKPCSLSPTAAQWDEIKRTAEITGMSTSAVYAFVCVATGANH